MKTFKVGQLNLDKRNQSERYDALESVLRDSNVDFLTFQEAMNTGELTNVFQDAGYPHVEFSGFIDNKGDLSHVGVASKSPLFRPSTEHMDGVIAVGTKVEDVTVYILSAHFAWGPDNLLRRTLQAEFVNQQAELFTRSESAIVVFGGDLNADEDTRPIRFLSGSEVSLDQKTSTFWTDSWKAAGTKNNWVTTSHSTNSRGRNTAFHANVFYPGLIPDRRIDYLMSYGWNYGKIGSPVSFGYLVDPALEISDHNGIYADFLLEV